MNKIWIYRWVFDPVHKGHISTIEESIKKVWLEKLYVAAKIIWKKNPYCWIEERKRMLLLALDNHNLPIEIIQQDPRWHSYDLKQLKNKHNSNLINICGSDKIIREMNIYWNSWDTFLSINRNGYKNSIEALKTSKKLLINLLEVDVFNTSSTDVRQGFHQWIFNQPDKLNNNVSGFINELNLYRTHWEILSHHNYITNRNEYRKVVQKKFPDLKIFSISIPIYKEWQSWEWAFDSYIRHIVNALSLEGEQLMKLVKESFIIKKNYQNSFV